MSAVSFVSSRSGTSPDRRRLPRRAKALAVLLPAVLAGFLLPDARAEFRGDEIEDRNWDYSSRYFFEVLSFRMPLAWESYWRGSDNGYRFELGSVLTDEFHIKQEAKLTYEEGDWIRFGFHFIQDEDFDSRFRRHRIEVEFKPWPWLKPAIYTEVDPFKEWIDLGAAIGGSVPNIWEGSIALTLVDAVYNRKAKSGEYKKLPFTLAHESTLFVVPGVAYVRFSAVLDFPLALDLPELEMVFRFRRTRLRVQAGVEITPGLKFLFSAGAEWARKKRNHDAYLPLDPRTDRFSRDAGDARIELSRTWRKADGFEEGFTGGFQWHQLFEVWRHSNAQDQDRRLWKRDFTFYGNYRFRISPPFYGVGSLFLGTLEHDDHYTHHPDRDHTRRHPVAIKLGFHLGFWFSPGVEIVPFFFVEGGFSRTHEEGLKFWSEFGGGGVNAIMKF